jgi:predicted patatin/cPLA2 family phospholipase
MIDTLVISGGGPTSLKCLGVIQYLTKMGFITKENIHQIYATSAGTMIAILFCLGIDEATVNNYIINRPWDKSIKIGLTNLFSLYEKKGLFDKELIEIIFEPLFSSLNIPINISLAQFYELIPIEIHFITLECNKFETVDVSYLNYPDLPVITAILMSSAIPNLFQPVIIGEQCFIDGGLFANYPLDICLKSGAIEKENILGLKNEYDSEFVDIDEKTNIIDFITTIFVKTLYINDKNKDIDIPNEIKINVDKMNMEMFHMALTEPTIREKWITDGQEIGADYLTNI